jgi:hypothetical protein
MQSKHTTAHTQFQDTNSPAPTILAATSVPHRCRIATDESATATDAPQMSQHSRQGSLGRLGLRTLLAGQQRNSRYKLAREMSPQHL